MKDAKMKCGSNLISPPCMIELTLYPMEYQILWLPWGGGLQAPPPLDIKKGVISLKTWKKLQACKHCLQTIFEKIVEFSDKQGFFNSFCSSMPTSLYYYPQLIYFCLKRFDVLGKKLDLGHF